MIDGSDLFNGSFTLADGTVETPASWFEAAEQRKEVRARLLMDRQAQGLASMAQPFAALRVCAAHGSLLLER